RYGEDAAKLRVAWYRRRFSARLGENLRQGPGVLFVARPRGEHLGQPRRLPHVLRGAEMGARPGAGRRDADAAIIMFKSATTEDTATDGGHGLNTNEGRDLRSCTVTSVVVHSIFVIGAAIALTIAS